MREPFGARLRRAMDLHGPVCAGLDPHPMLLASWGLTDSLAGLERFSLTTVEALAGQVACVKPQSALFERFGSAGIAVLERVLATLREQGTLSLLDVKRGDIGSTMAGYADAYLRDDAPLAADAITLSPYLGFESLRPALDLAADHGRGVFVLALTSNPEGFQVQHATTISGASVARQIVEAAAAENARELARTQSEDFLGSVGLVVGATIGAAPTDLRIDLTASRAPLLAPGVGAQGAGPSELKATFGSARHQVLASSSREILAAGPDPSRIRAAARQLAQQCRTALDT